MINCVIIDDEERARNGLSKMIATYCTGIKVVATAGTVKDGLATIKEHEPHLVFLDIDMPDGDGFELLSQVGEIDFDVIFATAYDQFAVKAFRFSAMDYLVKPIDLELLIEAVEKVKDKTKSNNRKDQYSVLQDVVSQHKFTKIALPSNDGVLFVEIGNIIRMESDGNYTSVIMTNGDKHMVTKQLGEYEDILNENGFFRIHHSNLINLNRIKKYIRGRGGYVVMEDGSSVDVSARRRDEFLAMMKGL